MHYVYVLKSKVDYFVTMDIMKIPPGQPAQGYPFLQTLQKDTNVKAPKIVRIF